MPAMTDRRSHIAVPSVAADPANPTLVERIADEMIALIIEDREADPRRYVDVRGFGRIDTPDGATSLHDVCDANEFIIEAAEALGIDIFDNTDDAEGPNFRASDDATYLVGAWIRRAFVDHEHQPSEDEDHNHACTVCGALICPDCGHVVLYREDWADDGGDYRHADGSECFLHGGATEESYPS